jgi:hypothetical protein
VKLEDHPLNPENIDGASRHDRERWLFYRRMLEKHLAAERPVRPMTSAEVENIRWWMWMKRRR